MRYGDYDFLQSIFNTGPRRRDEVGVGDTSGGARGTTKVKFSSEEIEKSVK